MYVYACVHVPHTLAGLPGSFHFYGRRSRAHVRYVLKVIAEVEGVAKEDMKRKIKIIVRERLLSAIVPLVRICLRPLAPICQCLGCCVYAKWFPPTAGISVPMCVSESPEGFECVAKLCLTLNRSNCRSCSLLCLQCCLCHSIRVS